MITIEDVKRELQSELSSKGISNAEGAKEIDIPHKSLDKYLYASTKPSGDNLLKILNWLGLLKNAKR